MRHRIGRLLLAAATLAATLSACSAIGDGPEDGCATLQVSMHRCQAIVEEARQQLGEHPPVTGISIIPATQDTKTTLRAQNLFATVRFSYVDGTFDAVPVYCGPARSPRLACSERPVPS